MMSSNNIEVQIREILVAIQKQAPGIMGFVVFTKDGFPITGTIYSDSVMVREYDNVSDNEFFAAIGAGILSLSERTLEQMNMLPLDKMTVESPRGNIVVEKVDDYIGVMAVSRPDAPVGLVRMALEKAKKKLKGLLGKAA